MFMCACDQLITKITYRYGLIRKQDPSVDK